ncbi:MAG: hypothetical protein KH135_01630 [Firmicutes bacterium]|nr:hypothetical protein [Bacillota bacterium]
MKQKPIRIIVLESDLPRVKELKQHFTKECLERVNSELEFVEPVYCGEEPNIDYFRYQEKFENGTIFSELSQFIQNDDYCHAILMDPCMTTADMFDCIYMGGVPTSKPQFETAKEVINLYHEQVPMCLLINPECSRQNMYDIFGDMTLFDSENYELYYDFVTDREFCILEMINRILEFTPSGKLHVLKELEPTEIGFVKTR